MLNLTTRVLTTHVLTTSCPSSDAPVPFTAAFKPFLPGPEFVPGPWGACDAVCGSGFAHRTVRCLDLARDNEVLKQAVCARYESAPSAKKPCQSRACTAACKGVDCSGHGGCHQLGVCTCTHGYTGPRCKTPPAEAGLRPLFAWEFDEAKGERDYVLTNGATVSGGLLNPNKKGRAAQLPDVMFGGTEMSFEVRPFMGIGFGICMVGSVCDVQQ